MNLQKLIATHSKLIACMHTRTHVQKIYAILVWPTHIGSNMKSLFN